MTTQTTNALLLLIVMALSGCDAGARTDATKSNPVQDSTSAVTANSAEVPITVAAVNTGTVAQTVVATGTYGPRDEIPLSFKIGGVVSRVLVDQGTEVRRGQVLAQLDLREIDALVDKARIGVEKAERDAARVARLVTDSVATLSQAQDANSALGAARADLATARVNREYATIVAPQAGLVQQRLITAGTTVGPGMPIFILGGSSRGRVLRVGVPDRDALRVRVGDAAAVTFDALRGTTYRGVVTLLGKSADVRTGTYAVEVELRDAVPGGSRSITSLPSGLVGRAEIGIRATTSGTRIPVEALIEADADSATVYTVSATTPLVAEPHRVRILQLIGDHVAVDGLDATARVIIRGAPYVTAGARVRIVAEPTTGKAAP